MKLLCVVVVCVMAAYCGCEMLNEPGAYVIGDGRETLTTAVDNSVSGESLVYMSDGGGGGEVTRIKDQPTLYRVKYNETVEIPCVIENRKNANVIWQYSKSRIPETLSVGYFYYRKDYRIRVIVNSTSEHEQSWNLEIRKVRFDDEGYYLCKVMAQPESLKRAVYLKVEVDMSLETVYPVTSTVTSSSSSHEVTLMCNTSFVNINETKMKYSRNNHNLHQVQQNQQQQQQPQQQQQQQLQLPQQHPKIIWLKDGHRLNYHHSHNNNHQHFTTINNNTLEYRIEHHFKPVHWSKLYIKSIKPTDMGVFTCFFRNQTLSTIVNFENATNKRLLDETGNRASNELFSKTININVCCLIAFATISTIFM